VEYFPHVSEFAVFDIDGVLADVRHRLEYVQTKPKQWDRFFGLAQLDPPLEEGVAGVFEALDAGHQVAYSTGRPERCRPDTEYWLRRHGLPKARVHMRAEEDRRPGRVTKLEVARRLRDQSGVAYLVDDDPVVVEALRKDGFVVVHATWMTVSESPSDHEQDAQQLLFGLQEEGRT